VVDDEPAGHGDGDVAARAGGVKRMNAGSGRFT